MGSGIGVFSTTSTIPPALLSYYRTTQLALGSGFITATRGGNPMGYKGLRDVLGTRPITSHGGSSKGLFMGVVLSLFDYGRYLEQCRFSISLSGQPPTWVF